MFQLWRSWLRDICIHDHSSKEPPPLFVGLVPLFVLGQHILASFWVIILSQVATAAVLLLVTLPLCFHALIGCFRKEVCVSLTLPVSCCVQQQSKAPLSTFSVEQGSCLSPDFSPLSRNPLIKYLSRESSTFIYRQWLKCSWYTNSLTFFCYSGDLGWKWICSQGALVQASCWVVCAGMHLDYRGDSQSKAIISAGLTTMHCSRHCSAKKRLVLLFSVAMWHSGYSHLQRLVVCMFSFFSSFSTWMAWHSLCLLVSGE